MLISVGIISLLVNDAAIAGNKNSGVMLATKQSSLNTISTQKRTYTSVRKQQGRIVLDTKTPRSVKASKTTGKKAEQNDLNFRSLKKKARTVIPEHSPEWSNQRTADPGETLLKIQNRNKQIRKNTTRKLPASKKPKIPAHKIKSP